MTNYVYNIKANMTVILPRLSPLQMELGGEADIPFYLEESSALLLLEGQETFIQRLLTSTYYPRFAAII